jgi:hypothetical protein
MADEIDEKLTPKQQAFVDAYLGDAQYNATEAARKAGYKGNYATLRAVGSENLTKPNIVRLLKRFTMSAEEVSLRLSEHATSSLKPFLVTSYRGQPAFDLSTPDAQAKLHLIKRVKIKQKSGGSGEKAWSEEETEIEVYDAQQALAHMGRIHALFTEKQQISGSIEFVEQASRTLDAKLLTATAANPSGTISTEPHA